VSSELKIHDYRFLSALIARQYDVHLISYVAPKRYPTIPRLIRDIKGLNIIHRQFEFTTGYTSFAPFVVLDFRRLLKSLKPDILHTGWVLRDGFLGALSGFHPVLLMPYGSDILIEPERSMVRRRVVKYTITRADIIQCDCETVKRKIVDMTRFDDHRIVVFPWGIELANFYPDPTKNLRIRQQLGWSNNKLLIMNRAFEPVYGTEYFIEALPEIVSQEPTTRVILIGSGSLERRLQSLVADRHLDSYVRFIGSISSEEMPAYLNAADVYVSTSLSDGTSSSLLEAMACSLPVVVTEIAANKEWVIDGHNGFLVRLRNPNDIAAKVITLLKDSNLRTLMGNNNVAIARDKADWEKNVDKLEAMYKSLFLSRAVIKY
jgi:glycosyltransferase involved in cell wall biosynthesis